MPQHHDLRILFVRHGQAVGDHPDDDPPLSDLGRNQAEAVAQRLSALRFDAIYASTMARAAQTADAIRSHHPDTPFESRPDLREVSWHLVGKGDPPLDPLQRNADRLRGDELRAFADLLLQRHMANDRILVVSHGCVARYVIACLAGVDPAGTVLYETANASVSEVIMQDGRFLWLNRVNDTRHLDGELDPLLG